ncbi:MAG: anthranilate synthase component 1 [Candidatus Marinimicrobia bacterium]|nr:anthranilate synthase component 1 [Candidatus Neomarinimicrobiota bacterium]
MEDFNRIKHAQKGDLVPIIKSQKINIDPVLFFGHLTNFGQDTNCILLESANTISKYGEKSIGAINPCLKIKGKGENFVIKALNKTGEYFLAEIVDDLIFCDDLVITKEKISGTLIPDKSQTDERERLKARTHFDILRVINNRFIPISNGVNPAGGIFGAISYDIIDQFEDLPPSKTDIIGDHDYEMIYVDNFFIMDHIKNEMKFVANALISNQSRDDVYLDCIKKLNRYEECLQLCKNTGFPSYFDETDEEIEWITDTEKENFLKKVSQLKEHILAGDIFQAVLCRTLIGDTKIPPYKAYKNLRTINPGPYMFYFNTSDGCILGSSPEMFIRVEGKDEKILEIRPIAGTKPRGYINGKIDSDLDSKYELELKLDPKEQAEHTMLIDLARNDVARVCQKGSRYVDEPFIIEKYSHVQHLVSNVSGQLKKEYDALHAYVASMNMGTLTGAPKIEAMKLIRLYETGKRGYYGGSVGYFTPDGNFDSCINIRSMRFKNGHIYIKVGAGIVYDSIPEKEWEETINKSRASVLALSRGGKS